MLGLWLVTRPVKRGEGDCRRLKCPPRLVQEPEAYVALRPRLLRARPPAPIKTGRVIGCWVSSIEKRHALASGKPWS